MRCCLIALNHHIVNPYEFLFVRNKINKNKKSGENLFTYSSLKISRDLLCFINATPGTTIQPTHPYRTFAKQPWRQLEWQTQDLGNIHQIYSFICFPKAKTAFYSTSVLATNVGTGLIILLVLGLFAFYCVHIVKQYSCCSRKILLEIMDFSL